MINWQLRDFRCLFIYINCTYFTEYEGDPWKNNLIAKMVKCNPKERPSFSTIVEVVEIHNATSSRSSFPPMSGKAFLNNSIYSGNEAKQNKLAFLAKYSSSFP